MCRPQIATPAKAAVGESAAASARSATTSSSAPAANTPQRPTRSERYPAGYAENAYTTFMITSTIGTSAGPTPTSVTFSSRNASLNRASVNRVATTTTHQYELPNIPNIARQAIGPLPASFVARSGSRTNSTSTATDTNAGITANQNTVRNWFAVIAISPIASSGPANAPIVSSVCRRPNAAPRISAGVRSAINASRGAPRIPLPMRSAKRAVKIQAMLGATANSGFVNAARP